MPTPREARMQTTQLQGKYRKSLESAGGMSILIKYPENTTTPFRASTSLQGF